jgi:hypothetical protein
LPLISRPHLHLDQRVIHVAGDARGSAELDAVVCQDVALDRPVLTTFGTATEPSTTPLSLTLSVAPESAGASTLPFTWPFDMKRLRTARRR